MSDNRYSGWANYETWNWALWLDNDQGAYEYWKERAEEALKDAEGDRNAAASNFADELESDADENMPEAAGPYADILRAALQAIDWREIADHYLSDIDVYSSGFNMPGCLPDADPAVFVGEEADEEARAALADDMETEADELETMAENHRQDGDGEQAERDEALAGELREAAEAVRKGRGEYGQTIGRFHYFVNKV